MSDDKKVARFPRPAPAPSADPIPARILHKREFLTRVAHQVNIPRAQIREVVEATLEQLGSAIAEGETLALPPFGKARVSRQRTTKGGEVLILRLRRKGAVEGQRDAAE